jgi:nicotinamide riboside transporter PnuC
MSIHSLSWILVALSLIGNVFVVKKNIIGQWVWAVSNVGWVAYNIYIGSYSQATLFAVYLGLCIWGIIVWSKDDKESKPPKPANT